MRVGFGKPAAVLDDSHRKGLTFNTHYTRYPYSSAEKELKDRQSTIKDSINNILYTVHRKIEYSSSRKGKETDKENEAEKVSEPTKETQTKEGKAKVEIKMPPTPSLTPTRKEKKQIAKTSRSILRKTKLPQVMKTVQIDENPTTYKNFSTEMSLNNELKGIVSQKDEKLSIAQLKAELLQRTQTNKRRYDINDYDAYEYRKNQSLSEVNQAKHKMDYMIREFNRIKNEHEGITSELYVLRDNLRDLDDRLTDTVLTAKNLIVASVTDPSYKKKSRA